MNYFKIEGLDQPVSQLIMGSDYFAPDVYELVSRNLDAFLAIGGNTIDTAFVYSGGKSEEAIGMWLEERRNRDQVRVWTKGAAPQDGVLCVNRKVIREELEISLERLRTDFVDLYALHRDDPSLPVGPIVEALNELLEEGKIRTFGGSNWTWQRLEVANAYAAAHGLRGFSFNSPNLSLAKAQEPYWIDCVSVDEETARWHEKTGMPILSWSSQARGFFTGRFTPEDRSDADLVRVFYNDDNWERYRRAEQMARDKNVTTIQIALAYVLNQPFPCGALIGARNEQEMKSCHEATEIRLTREEMTWLDLSSEQVTK
jgi:aryl-alcohol dehydrogenase-like predicted oxidoreductase